MCPDSIKGAYLGGIAATFGKMELHDTAATFRAAITDPEIKAVLKGFSNIYDAQHPKATRKKLAFGADFAMKSYALIVGALSFYFSKLNFVHTAKDTATQLILLKRMRMAAFTGIFGLLRCGEYLVSNKGKAAPFKNSDIWFFDYHNNRISFELIGIVPAKYLKIMIPFSKTDSSGWGRSVTHYRISTKIGNRDLCFVDEAVQWICETRRLGSTENDLFFHLPGFGQLPKADLEKFMNVAIENWYDTNETDLPIAARKYATSHYWRSNYVNSRNA
jgi:hypothetical protein